MNRVPHDKSFAPYACMSCRKQKRKCTKEIPRCKLCERLQKPCNYEDARSSSTQQEVFNLQSRVDDLESRLKIASHARATVSHDGETKITPRVTGGGTQRNGHGSPPDEQPFPAMFFLDSEVCRLSPPRISEPCITVPEHITSMLGGLNDHIKTASAYFKTIHLWLPFISKKRMELALSSPNFKPKPDMVALLLTMQLLVDPTGYEAPQSQLYFLTKTYIDFLESHAFMSIHLIQASVLVAAYEIGHAVYPTAYLSPARAARMGQAYGIDNRRGAPQMGLGKLGSWAENQEVTRTWWAIMVLDRFVNLNIEGHALATNEPRQNDVLPADCTLWDNGEQSTSEPLYIFTPTNVRVSPFARTCQAGNLMGRYVRHRNDDNIENVHRYQEALQLHRTVTAFAKLLPEEVKTNPLQYSPSLALAYSILLHIYDPYSCAELQPGQPTAESVEMQAAAIAGLPQTAADILEFSQLLASSMLFDLQGSNPFVIECIYHAATQYAWLVHENGPGDMITAYNSLKEKLDVLSQRWALAKEYLQILDHTKNILYNGNALL